MGMRRELADRSPANQVDDRQKNDRADEGHEEGCDIVRTGRTQVAADQYRALENEKLDLLELELTRILTSKTEETKEQALDKLAKFRPHIGFPTQWRDYGRLEIAADDLIGNVMRVAGFELDRSLSKIGQPIDRGSRRACGTVRRTPSAT